MLGMVVNPVNSIVHLAQSGTARVRRHSGVSVSGLGMLGSVFDDV